MGYETGLDSDVTRFHSRFFGSIYSWLLGLGGLCNLLGDGRLGSSSLILSRLLSRWGSLKGSSTIESGHKKKTNLFLLLLLPGALGTLGLFVTLESMQELGQQARTLRPVFLLRLSISLRERRRRKKVIENKKEKKVNEQAWPLL